MYKVVSLFSGCGGGDLGMKGGFDYLDKHYHSLPFQTIYANEIDPKIAGIFNQNFGVTPDVRDIREVSTQEIPDHDVLVGGFPCVSFSIVAQNPPRLGIKHDVNGKLFDEMVKVLEDKQPKAFIAENVKGLMSANKGQAFPLIKNAFKNAGYTLFYKVLNAADYGVPQKRERIFIIGLREDLKKEYKFPEPLFGQNKSLDYIPLERVIFPEHEIDKKYFFSDKAIQGMINSKKNMNKGRAQDITKPCNTVGAHLAKMSLNSTDPVLKIDGHFRRFTPREVARIQSFPENYKLDFADGHQYRALGNAIPPVMMWHVAKNLNLALKSNFGREMNGSVKQLSLQI